LDNSNISSIGRFSSQMLTYFGTQRTVKTVTGTAANTFKYDFGNTVFPSPGSVSQSNIATGVAGSANGASFDSTKSFFLSRGASQLYADTMTVLTLDIASILGVTPQSLVENASFIGKLSLSPDAYRAFNELRDPGDQLAVISPVSNRRSPQARSIRA
jgi:hypothetical protein